MLVAMLAFAGMAACSRMEETAPEADGRTFIGSVRGTILDVPQSKTSVSASTDAYGRDLLDTKWSIGDEISVTDGSTVAVYTCGKVGDASTSADFTGSGSFDTSGGLWAIYPAESLVSQDGSSMCLSVPGRIGPEWGAADLKFGYGDPGADAAEIGFVNLLSVLQVNLKLDAAHGIEFGAGETLKTVTVEETSGMALSGEFSLERAAEPGVLSPVSSASRVVCDLEGESLSTSETLTLYFHVAPGTCGTLRFTIVTSGHTITRDVAIGEKLLRNCFYTINLTSIKADSPYTVKANNLRGQVTCGGSPVAGVAVSDGYTVTETGADGWYYLSSEKTSGYVFISQPQGYEVPIDGVFPQFWQSLTSRASVSTVEEHDFTLTAVDNSDAVLLTLGDFHLCHRSVGSIQDLEQFKLQTDDLVSRINGLKAAGKKVYGLTLGDMTWDIYWTEVDGWPYYFDLNAYKTKLNQNLAGAPIQVWQTIGNHDYDAYQSGDWDTAEPYRSILGPTYYSFNIGGYHVISLDNIICTNDGTSAGRSNNPGISDYIFDWLREDIAKVSADTPVIISMHEPTYRPTDALGNYKSESYASELISVFSGRKVHLVTGHTHNLNNVEVSPSVYEHNAGALCSTWWWTGRYSMEDGATVLDDVLQVARDGSPSGYTQYELSSGSMQWRYVPFGGAAGKLFKTYDRNEFALDSATWCPNATEDNKTKFEKLAAKGDGTYSYVPAADGSTVPMNLVYINVWDYDPSWTISVTENGSPLFVEPLKNAYDPLHMVAYPAKRYNQGEGANTSSSFVTCATQHIFRVQASSPNSTLVITVTDRFGNTATETMTRPKAFGLDWN